MTREGYIEKIKYKSDETGYCVMIVEGEDGEEIFVGTLPGASEGLYVMQRANMSTIRSMIFSFSLHRARFRCRRILAVSSGILAPA